MTAEILDTDAVCMLSDLMFPQPLNETSAVHVAACVVAAFEHLHQQAIVFRGLTPSTVAVDTNGLAQLVEVRCVWWNAALSLHQPPQVHAAIRLLLCKPSSQHYIHP